MAIKTFNTESNPQSQVLPTQTAVLKQMLQAFGQQLRVGLPGYFVSYDYKTQLATVQPSFSNQYPDGTVSPMPQIYNVPVRWPSSSISYDHHPIVAGDRCTLHFADKALDLWLSSGATSQPDDNRTHHISDAWAEPGLRPTNEPLPVSNGEDLLRTIGNLQLRMKANGHVQLFTGLGTAGSLEAISLINQFMRDVVTNNMSGAAAVQRKFKNFVEA